MKTLTLPLAAAALTVACLSGASVGNAQQPAPTPSCFSSHGWSSWKVSPDSTSMYIKSDTRRVYKLAFAGRCGPLNGGHAHLVTRTRGSGWICHPLDLDLAVGNGHGIAVSCIVKKITPLSSEEAAALSKSVKP